MPFVDLVLNPKSASLPENETLVSLYTFTPNEIISIIALTCLSLFIVLQALFAFCWRSTGNRVFSLLVVIGCSVDLAGYALRMVATQDRFNSLAWEIPYILLKCAPVFYWLAIFIAFTSVLNTTPKLVDTLPFDLRSLNFVFLSGQCLTLLAQVTGASLSAVSQVLTASAYLFEISVV